MPLTDTECRAAKCPEDRAFIRLADAGGLYLEVTRPGSRNPGGSKLWRWKYRFLGKEKRLALGHYLQVSLAEARREHAKARDTLAQAWALAPCGERPRKRACWPWRTRLSRWPDAGGRTGARA